MAPGEDEFDTPAVSHTCQGMISIFSFSFSMCAQVNKIHKMLTFFFIYFNFFNFNFFYFLFLNDFIYLFLERVEGREKERERNINVWWHLTLPN